MSERMNHRRICLATRQVPVGESFSASTFRKTFSDEPALTLLLTLPRIRSNRGCSLISKRRALFFHLAVRTARLILHPAEVG